MEDEMQKKEQMDDQEDSECVEYTVEELAGENNVAVNALIDLLIEKKIITEEEFNKKLEEFCDEECDCDETCTPECECACHDDDEDCECEEVCDSCACH